MQMLLLPSVIRAACALQSSSQHSNLVLFAVLSSTQPALQWGVSTASLFSPSGSHQLVTARPASSRSRGRKYPSHVKGYDRLLHQWADMTAAPSSSSKTRSSKAPKPHTFAKSKVGQQQQQQQHSSRKRYQTSSSSWDGGWYGWQDVDMAEAAAAAHLHPDEVHNLVFGRSSTYNSYTSSSSSSSSSKGRSKRQQRKEERQRAKALRKQAAATGAAYAEFGFAWAAADGSAGPWYASDSDSSSDDEYMTGTYRYYTAGSNQRHQRWHDQQQRRQQQQPDWQWWSEEQERQWFQQAWQQHAGGQAGSSQQRQQQAHSAGQGAGSTYHRPWWERFEQQHRQSHKQGRQQQQQWRHSGYGSSGSAGTHSSSSSSDTGTGAGADSRWQHSGPAHTPSILQHLSVLGLPSSTQLHRQQLKVAFHKAAMQWHPDKHLDMSAKAIAEAKFKEVKAAYEVLVQHVRT